MTTNNTNVTVTINNQTVTADLSTIASLLNMALETSMETVKPKAQKPKAPKPKINEKAQEKAHETRSKHDAVLDSKRIERMVNTAIKRLEEQGIEAKASKQGKWIWLYPCGKSTGKGRAPEFKDAKLAKGWKHSMKRGAFYRDFSEA